MTFIRSQSPYFKYFYSAEGSCNPPPSTSQNELLQNNEITLDTRRIFLHEHSYDQVLFQAPMEYPCYDHTPNGTVILPSNTVNDTLQNSLENAMLPVQLTDEEYCNLNHFFKEMISFYPVKQQTPQCIYNDLLFYPFYGSSDLINPSISEPFRLEDLDIIHKEAPLLSSTKNSIPETQSETHAVKMKEIVKNFVFEVNFSYNHNSLSLLYKYQREIDAIFEKIQKKKDFREKIKKLFFNSNEFLIELRNYYITHKKEKIKFINFIIYIADAALEHNKKKNYNVEDERYIDNHTIAKTFFLTRKTIYNWKFRAHNLNGIYSTRRHIPPYSSTEKLTHTQAIA